MRNTSPGALILGLFAVLFGLVGAYGAKKHLQQAAPDVKAEVPAEQLVTIPLAVRNLDEGRKVSGGDVTTARVTREQATAMNLPTTYMVRASEIIGRTLRQAIPRGQAFDPTAFYPDGIGPSVADKLIPGKRAVTIPFDGSAAEAGLVTPGAMVDVLFRAEADNPDGLPETTVTLLENVQVVAVNRETAEGTTSLDTGRSKERTVTLSVDPVQARALAVVQDRGALTLVLRHIEDVVVANEPAPATLGDLLGVSETRQPRKTEIYRRGQLTTVEFDEQGVRTIQESPFDLPVASRPNQSVTREASYKQSSNRQTLNKQSSATSSSTSSCGCGSSNARSVLAKG